MDISGYLLSRYEDDHGNFIKKVVTQGEIWFLHLTQSQNAEQTIEEP